MSFKAEYLRLYAVTDRTWLNGRTLASQVEAVIKGGATLIQLREKNMPEEDFAEEAADIKRITDAYGIPLIINDNIEVCLRSHAAGVHIGQSDIEADYARQLLGPDKYIGVTAKTVEQALKARAMGADYIGSGAVFGSTTKTDTKKMTLAQLTAICSAAGLPVVAIGGIQENNILQLKGCGMAGVAVVSALFSGGDAEAAAKRLLSLVQKII